MDILQGISEQTSSLTGKAPDMPNNLQLQIRDIICGIACFPDKATVTGSTGIKTVGYKGNSCGGWQAFKFKIDTRVEFMNANTSIALLGISNAHAATDLNYTFKDIVSTKAEGGVEVTGEVLIGDSDGYLNQLSYVCVLS